MDWRQAHQLQHLSTCTLNVTSADAQCFITLHLGVNGCCDYVGLYYGKEKTTPFGVNLMRSQVLYRAAQDRNPGCTMDKHGSPFGR